MYVQRSGGLRIENIVSPVDKVSDLYPLHNCCSPILYVRKRKRLNRDNTGNNLSNSDSNLMLNTLPENKLSVGKVMQHSFESC